MPPARAVALTRANVRDTLERERSLRRDRDGCRAADARLCEQLEADDFDEWHRLIVVPDRHGGPADTRPTRGSP